MVAMRFVLPLNVVRTFPRPPDIDPLVLGAPRTENRDHQRHRKHKPTKLPHVEISFQIVKLLHDWMPPKNDELFIWWFKSKSPFYSPVIALLGTKIDCQTVPPTDAPSGS
jgi:hypothetical protein